MVGWFYGISKLIRLFSVEMIFFRQLFCKIWPVRSVNKDFSQGPLILVDNLYMNLVVGEYVNQERP